MTVSPRIRIAALALLALAVIALYVSIRHAATVARLVALVTTAQDEALGPDFTKVRKLRNIAATVPDLAAALAKAKAAGTKPLAGVRVRSGPTEFHPPDRRPATNPAGTPEVAGAMLPPSSPPLLVSAETQGAIVGLADGSIQQTWKMFATLKQGEWSERRQLEDITADVAIDPAVAAAWKAAQGPPTYRLDVYLGASLGTDGAGITGGVMGGRGRAGWFAAVDYLPGDPGASRVGGGGRFTLKK